MRNKLAYARGCHDGKPSISDAFRFQRALIAGALMSLQACGALAAEATRATCPGTDAPDYYFPAGVFDDGSKRSDWDPDAFSRDWYSQHLRAAGVPSLSC